LLLRLALLSRPLQRAGDLGPPLRRSPALVARCWAADLPSPELCDLLLQAAELSKRLAGLKFHWRKVGMAGER